MSQTSYTTRLTVPVLKVHSESMERMKIGIQLPEVEWEVPFPELIEMAQEAEAVGFDSVWYGDHLIYDLAVGARGPWEAWTTLAAIAQATTTIELGPLVASTSFHAPTMLAKQAATVDAISQGRLIVGLGAGWNQREYDAFGFAYDKRVSRFEEAFTIIRTLLADGEIDFHGTFYDAEQCVLHPRSPRPGGPPLMVGSIGDRMLDITLPHVDSWNMWWSQYGNTAAGFAHEKSRVDQLIQAAGRSINDVEATAAVHIRLADGKGRLMGDYVGDADIKPLTGSPDELGSQLQEFESAGAAHIQLCVDPITRDSINWLGNVLSAFHRTR
ncbi:MAG: LLM class flavin-dependent oxidoreductase [Ilumatobacter sp.]|uniref:LLM class flavin-dependent oxidoreductase n=1 Tax=Ilumatobacter sp. TaxID=1967498 RepID=UPI003753DE0B|nr:LLM class flavin-dependent oxidoreductase [Ilumatobacter sp.]